MLEFMRKRKIKKLSIQVAKYKALSESSARYAKGDTNTSLISIHQGHIARLAVASKELEILEGEG